MSAPVPFDRRYHGWCNISGESNKQHVQNNFRDIRNDVAAQKPQPYNGKLPALPSNTAQSKNVSTSSQNEGSSEASQPIDNERILLDKKTKESVLKSPPNNNKNSNTQISRIPLPIKEKTRSSEKDTGSKADNERLQGAIRKQPKNKNSNHTNKTNIPTTTKHSDLLTSDCQDTQMITDTPVNLNSGDIVNDVLYISTPLKPPNIGQPSSDKFDASVISSKHDNLQSFQLIAPDNFMIYKALSVTHDIDSTKPLVTKISDTKVNALKSASNKEVSRSKKCGTKGYPKINESKNLNTSTVFFYFKQHSLEEFEPSNITNGNGVYLPNDPGVHHNGNNQRKDSRQFHSGKYFSENSVIHIKNFVVYQNAIYIMVL